MGLRKEKILVTGGLGFIFSHVTEYLVKRGHEVVVIDNLSEGSHPEIVDTSFKHLNLDMATPAAHDAILEENPTYLIHAAAYSDVDRSIQEPQYILRQNIEATVQAFEAMRKLPNLKKFLYVSTDEVYGECDGRKKEGDALLPRNPYSCSKAVGSLLHITYENTYPALKGKIVESRFCNVFGPRQDERKIMPIIKNNLETGEPVPMFDSGGSYREYIYIDNIPPAVELILTRGVGIYNVTLNDGFMVRDLIKKAEEVTGKSIKTKLSHRPGIDMKYQMDSTRIKELGWKPLFSFEEGLKTYLIS